MCFVEMSLSLDGECWWQMRDIHAAFFGHSVMQQYFQTPENEFTCAVLHRISGFFEVVFDPPLVGLRYDGPVAKKEGKVEEIEDSQKIQIRLKVIFALQDPLHSSQKLRERPSSLVHFLESARGSYLGQRYAVLQIQAVQYVSSAIVVEIVYRGYSDIPDSKSEVSQETNDEGRD